MIYKGLEEGRGGNTVDMYEIISADAGEERSTLNSKPAFPGCFMCGYPTRSRHSQ